MSNVRIVQLRRICRVLCTCGLDKYMAIAPERCPACGCSWDQPQIEETHRENGVAHLRDGD